MNQPVFSRPRPLREVLDAAFDLFREHAAHYLALTLLFDAPFVVAANWTLLRLLQPGGVGDRELAALSLCCAAGLLLRLPGAAAISSSTAEFAAGRPVALGSALASAMRHAIPAAGLGALAWTLAAGAFFLCCGIGGPLVLIAASFMVPLYLFENLSYGRALARSASLTAGMLGDLAAIYGIFGLWASLAGANFVALFLLPSAFAQKAFPNVLLLLAREPLVWLIILSLPLLVLDGFKQIAMTCLYFNCKVDQEAYDIESRIRELARP